MEITKEKRISKEKNRLNKIFKVEGEPAENGDKRLISVIKGKPVESLIERAAFMRVLLEDLEDDINKNGYTEMFTQSENAPPYERKRPCVELYNTTVKNFTVVCKQLQEFIPEQPHEEKSAEMKEFEKFTAMTARV